MTDERRPEHRPDAVTGPQLVELCLYVGPALFATGTHQIEIASGNTQGFELRAVASARDYAFVTMLPGAPGPGPWQWSEVDVQVNGQLWGSRKPLVWYAGEPSDWASGLVRWEWPAHNGAAAVVAALTIRRER